MLDNERPLGTYPLSDPFHDMVKTRNHISEPGAEAAEPSPGDVDGTEQRTEKRFLRKVRRNMEVDTTDCLDGPKAQDKPRQKGSPQND